MECSVTRTTFIILIEQLIKDKDVLLLGKIKKVIRGKYGEFSDFRFTS